MAKKFKFKLDPVLNLRNQKKKEAEDSLQQAANIRKNKENEIIHKNGYLNNLNNSNTKTMNLQDIQALHYHKNYVEDNIKKLEKEKKDIIEIENLRRKKLSEAMKEEKVLEKLKDKKRNIHNESIKKEENEFMDEVGLRNSKGYED